MVLLCLPALGLAAAPEGPCPFFDVTMVQRIFPNSTNKATFKRRDKPFESCTYLWKSKHPRLVKMAGREVPVPLEGRLTLTKVATRAEDRDWERVLQGYRKQKLEPVPELGKHAVWSAQRRQLSWIAKGHIFHVAVQDSDQPDLQRKSAMTVAAALNQRH